MPVNSQGEEVDDLDWECEQCGSTNGQLPDEEWEAVAGMTCLDCGWVDM